MKTGARQWGSPLAFAGALFGLEISVYMVRVSYNRKPYRRALREAWGAHQAGCFEAGVRFARAEGMLPAPEANHAVKGAIEEALKCRRDGISRVILFSLCGHGHFDMQAYIDFHDGKLTDQQYDEKEFAGRIAVSARWNGVLAEHASGTAGSITAKVRVEGCPPSKLRTISSQTFGVDRPHASVGTPATLPLACSGSKAHRKKDRIPSSSASQAVSIASDFPPSPACSNASAGSPPAGGIHG